MKTFSKSVIVTTLAIASIGLAIVYNGQKMAQNNAAPKTAESNVIVPNISVIQAVPNTYQASITSHGEAKAHWELTLKAQVSGEVISVNDSFKTGNIIKKGNVLANIDNTDYLDAISGVKATLADALLAFQEEKDLGEQARREWERSGVTEEPSSPLVFRTLQLEAEQATVDNAQYNLKTAIRDEKNTHIRAPFNAVILSRDIQLGSYVSVGDTIATLNSSDKVEVFVPLSTRQFKNLPSNFSGDVTLSDVVTNTQWQGYIDRIENHLDSESRQRNIVVAVEQPFSHSIPLLPGTFLSVDIPGKTLDSVLKIPASAISQDGEVWYVDTNNTLVNVVADKIFERGDYVYIAPIEGINAPNIVVRPLASYVSGMLVNPVLEEQH